MHHLLRFSKKPLWLFGIGLIACGGRTTDVPDSGSIETGGSAGAGATGGSTAGASGDGPVGAGAGGSGGATGGSGGSGGATGGSGGSGGATGGSGGTGGATGGSGGTGGATGGSGGFGAGGSGGVGGINDGGMAGCFCTRRPGPGVSLKCPPGADQSTAGNVGPSGGTVIFVGQQGVGCQLTVPPNAFDKEFEVVITETSIPPPQEFFDWSPIYELQPAGVTSPVLMKLRLPWRNRDGSVPPTLAVYHARDKGGPFARVSDFYINAGFTDAGITEFGFYFVGDLKSAAQSACP